MYRVSRARFARTGLLVTSLPFFSRIGVAFRVLFDGEAAFRAAAPALPPAAPSPALPPEPAPPARDVSALVLLSVLQAEGRLLDFVGEDVSGFSDADVGAAARSVHDGCRKALARVAKATPVRKEAEGARVQITADDPPATYKVVGAPRSAPFSGVLRHAGWRVDALALPELAKGADPSILAPAEVEG